MNRYGKGKVVWGKTPRQVLEQSGIGPDFDYISQDGIRLEYIHRELADLDIYFVRSTDSVTAYVETFFRAEGVPELWDPDNGSRTRIPVYQAGDQTTRIPLKFAPYDSYIITFQRNKQKDIENY